VRAGVTGHGRQFAGEAVGLRAVEFLEPELEGVDAGRQRRLDGFRQRSPRRAPVGDERQSERDQRPGTPSIGDEAVAYSFIGIRPAS
jgi:hypothetical protein